MAAFSNAACWQRGLQMQYPCLPELHVCSSSLVFTSITWRSCHLGARLPHALGAKQGDALLLQSQSMRSGGWSHLYDLLGVDHKQLRGCSRPAKVPAIQDAVSRVAVVEVF